MDWNRIVELAKVFARRAARGDFQQERARDDERAALAARNCSDPLVQDYAAWRRALLAIAAVALALTVVIGCIGYRSISSADRLFGGLDLGLLDLVPLGLLLANLAGAVCVALSAWRWTELERSRKLARRGWLA